MKRRKFLKLCCAAVVAPSLSVSNTCCGGYTETTYNELLRLVRERRDAARQALIDDLERHFRIAWTAAIEDIPKSGWDWIEVSVPIHYKQ